MRAEERSGIVLGCTGMVLARHPLVWEEAVQESCSLVQVSPKT